MSNSTLRVASVQFQHRPGDKAYNLSRIATFAVAAAAESVQLVIFPEMCITGYWHVTKLDIGGLEALAEPLDGLSISAIRDLAREYCVAIGAGLIERAPRR